MKTRYTTFISAGLLLAAGGLAAEDTIPLNAVNKAAEAGSPDPADLPPPPDPAEAPPAEVASDADPAPVSVTQHGGEPQAQKSGRPRGSAARRRWGDSAG